MSDTDYTAPAVYVGTYHKYNCGSIAGQWIHLDEFTDKDEFYSACQKLHKDELDPELMFQDWENVPEQFIGESWLSDEFWEYMELLDNSHLDHEAINAGLELGIPLNKLEDAYYGYYESNTDLAYEYIESTGLLADVPDSIANYFDYESFGRDLAYDFAEQDGHYFNANW